MRVNCNAIEFCCLWISLLVGPPVPLRYSNYDEQSYDQLQRLFELVRDIETPIVMGDFHHGPTSRREGVVYAFPIHYGLMNAEGFVSPYVLLDGRCTICSDNPVRIRPTSFIIDHIYVLADSYEERVISAEV